MRKPPFSLRRKIYFGDCEPAGVLYTPRVAHFAVEAMHDFMSAQLGGDDVRQISEMGVLPPVRALSCEFLSMLTWGEEIEIRVQVAEIHRSSYALAMVALKSDGQKAFSARMTQVCIDPQTQRPVPIPEALRAVLEQNLNTFSDLGL